MQLHLITAFVLLVASTFIVASYGHVCLLSPPQRGGYDVSEPGSMTCFQPDGPCGTIAAGTPNITLIGGTGHAVLFQQNLNHYNPGWPGFLDVSWAVGPNPSESSFKQLTATPDYWPHLQAQQTNISLVVTVPNVDCARCILRVRYHPNKPTEPIFHQCSDVKIVKQAAPSVNGRVFALAQYGSFDDSYLVEINADGRLDKRTKVPFQIRSPSGAASFSGLANGGVAVDQEKQLIYFLGFPQHDTVASDSKASLVITYDIAKNEFTEAKDVGVTDSTQWTALVSNFAKGRNASPYLVGLINDGNQNFRFQIKQIDAAASASSFPLLSARDVGNFPDDATFVNYFWSEYDSVRNKLYVLSGDENSLFKLNVRLYTVDIARNNVTWVSVANTQFTVSSIHVDPSTGKLLALSPGLFPSSNGRYAWTLVNVDPATGSVAAVAGQQGGVSAPGEFSYFYGGGVYGTSLTSTGHILHTFKSDLTGSTVLGLVDKSTGAMLRTSAINTGRNNYINLNTITFVPNK